LDKLDQACAGPGTAYDHAPAYTSDPPHPIIVFVEFEGDYQHESLDVGTSSPRTPDGVQLVACVNRTGADAYAGPTCCYRNGLIAAVETVQRAHYAVDVYELRTHRRVASYAVDGDDMSCPQMISKGAEIYSRLSASTYYRFSRPDKSDCGPNPTRSPAPTTPPYAPANHPVAALWGSGRRGDLGAGRGSPWYVAGRRLPDALSRVAGQGFHAVIIQPSAGTVLTVVPNAGAVV